TVDRLIDIKPARALHHLAFEADGSLRIGALTTLAEIERSAELAERLPILAQSVPDAELLAPPTAEERVEYRLSAGELLTEIRVPAQSEHARGVYLKAMDRRAWAFALVSAAAQLTLDGDTVTQPRLALGGVANVPWRVTDAEALLEGQPLTPELAAQAADLAVQGATPLAHNRYKVAMARELARRAILMA